MRFGLGCLCQTGIVSDPLSSKPGGCTHLWLGLSLAHLHLPVLDQYQVSTKRNFSPLTFLSKVCGLKTKRGESPLHVAFPLKPTRNPPRRAPFEKHPISCCGSASHPLWSPLRESPFRGMAPFGKVASAVCCFFAQNTWSAKDSCPFRPERKKLGYIGPVERLEMGALFSVVYFTRGTLPPKKGREGRYWGTWLHTALSDAAWTAPRKNAFWTRLAIFG